MSAYADDSNFSAHLHAKFQVKACTTCHDFFDKERGGLLFKSHEGRTPDMCVYCHTKEVTGFKHPDEWFAQPGLYLSRMDAQQTCEAIKTALHAKFKSNELIARQIEHHLFEDPRVLWGIEGATPNSGMLPSDKKEKDLVKEGFTKWKDQVRAWIQGGMKCQ
jgi:predicted CXXCH cytochrome family protein